MGVNTPRGEEQNIDKVKDKGSYVGVEDELSEEDHGLVAEDEDLSEMWNQMNFALESSKVLL